MLQSPVSQDSPANIGNAGAMAVRMAMERMMTVFFMAEGLKSLLNLAAVVYQLKQPKVRKPLNILPKKRAQVGGYYGSYSSGDPFDETPFVAMDRF